MPSTTTAVPVQPRTVNRGSNPFAAIAKQQNAALTPTTPNSVYEKLQVRGDRVFKDGRIQQALADLKTRLGGKINHTSANLC